MERIITYEKPNQFLERNKDTIYGNYLVYYHLIQKIEDLTEGKSDLFDSFNVVDDSGSDILCMWVTGAYYIYGNSWTAEIVKVLSDKIDLDKFKNFAFCGQRNLIQEIFDYSNVKGQIFKSRFIEVCETVKEPKSEFKGQIENGSIDDYDVLIEMSYDYNQEEFHGQGSHTRESIAAIVSNAIENRTIYVWRVNGEITSIVKIINNHEEIALIGSLFTKKDARGKGYAFFLLHSLTIGLLENGFVKCGLVSDADNPITKKIFNRVGYEPIYNWGLIRKET